VRCDGFGKIAHAALESETSLQGNSIVPVKITEQGQIIDNNQPHLDQQDYCGIGRLGYFLGSMLCAGVGGYSFISSGGHNSALFVVFLALIVQTALVFQRLINIGWNGWLALIGFIPLVGLWVSIPAAIFPEGYANTRKLDRTGRILLILLGSFFGGTFILVAISFIITINS
jgi:uncharacterized membrane protein YhaH (DUF805 family)